MKPERSVYLENFPGKSPSIKILHKKWKLSTRSLTFSWVFLLHFYIALSLTDKDVAQQYSRLPSPVSGYDY